MRRSYRQSKYLGIIERVRAAMPDAAITTDIIVGFPGETEEDFQATLDVVREARFSGAFTFQYSKRPGTPAADLPDQISPEVVKDRYERLAALVNDIAWEENKRLVGRTVELMVAEGEGRKDAATHRLSGRAPDNRLVHFTPLRRGRAVRPGDMVTVEITYAAPHHLVADGPVLAMRRTRSGDAWEARTAAPAAVGRRARHADARRTRAAAGRPRLPLIRARIPRPAGEFLHQRGRSDAPGAVHLPRSRLRRSSTGARLTGGRTQRSPHTTLRPMDQRTRTLLAEQDGVIARRQLLALGVGVNDLARLVRRRELARVHPGVFCDHTGPLTWHQRAWAAVLVGGRSALGLQSAIRAAEGPGRRGEPATSRS